MDDVLENEDIENLLEVGRHQMTDLYVFGLYSFGCHCIDSSITKTDLSPSRDAGISPPLNITSPPLNPAELILTDVV